MEALASKSVSVTEHHAATGRLRFLARNRYQLLGAMALAVVAPAILRSQFAFINLSIGGPTTTAIGAAVALLLGAYALRKMTGYAGAQALAYVIPIFAASFVSVVVVLFLARLDYSRAQFVAGFVATSLWYLFVLRVERTVIRPRFLVVPFGDVRSLMAWAGADWALATSDRQQLEGFAGIVADLRAEMPGEWQHMLAEAALQGKPVYHTKQLAETLTGRVEIEHLSENNLGSLLPSSVYSRLKRLADTGLTLATLPVTMTLIAVASIAIKVIEGSPVFYRQERVGFRGKSFSVIKLRTMKKGSDAGAHFTDDDDSRITGLGRVLRRLRIDELPQLINILRGEMSWIGPRPEARSLAEQYESKIPFYGYRHIIRPGISGWAAVHQGNVGEVEAATLKLQYDFYYIKHFGLWLDILIFMKTIRVIVTGFGAR